jgi:hypothetical protein
MAVIVTSNYKVSHDGVTEKGPLLANDKGLAVGKSRTEKISFFKKRTTTEPGYYVVRWDDATSYEITKPAAHMLGGSTINSYDVTLIVKTAATQHAFTLHHTDEVTVRNQLGPFLAKIDARNSNN